MTARRETFLCTLLVFISLGFVPIVDGGGKMGWLPVWEAYPVIFSAGGNRQWDAVFVVASLVIIAHCALAAAIASFIVHRRRLGR